MTENAITYKDLRLSIGGVLASIRELFIEEQINHHGKLQLMAIVDETEQQQVLFEAAETFQVFFIEAGTPISLFQGVITELKMQVYGDIYLLSLEAQTVSYFMDLMPVKRIFQDITMTSHQLVEQVMADYSGSQCLLSIPDVSLDEIVVQYEETDWEFLKRFVSRYGGQIFVDCNGIEQRLTLGLPDKPPAADWSDKPYQQRHQLEHFHFLENNTKILPSLKHSLVCLVSAEEVLPFGSSVILDGMVMHIGAVRRNLHDGILMSEYHLYHREGLIIPKYYNDKITGVSLNGIVTKVQRNKIQAALEIERQAAENRYWFPFSTVAASSDGSGWYCMPEQGEQVRIYFPIHDEKEGYAITNIQGHNPESPQPDDPMSNPDTKNISASDKHISFTEDGIIFNANDGNGELQLSQDGEITLNAKEAITIEAVEKIVLYAENELEISSEGEIAISNDAGVRVLIMEGQLDINGDKIHFNLPPEEGDESESEGAAE